MNLVAVKIQSPDPDNDGQTRITTIYVNPDKVQSIEPDPSDNSRVFIVVDKETMYLAAEPIAAVVGRFACA